MKLFNNSEVKEHNLNSIIGGADGTTEYWITTHTNATPGGGMHKDDSGDHRGDWDDSDVC